MPAGKKGKKKRRIKPKIKAKDRFAPGPAAATFREPYFRSRKLYGLIGTGFAQPIPMPVVRIERIGTTTEPIGSKCLMGFRVRRPAYFAVGSPK